jgi:hypothetical protein
MLPTLMYHIKESIHGHTTTQVWSARHDLGVVDYKALIGLLLLWLPHFCARCGASQKDLNPDTTSSSKDKCFHISREKKRKYTNVGEALVL